MLIFIAAIRGVHFFAPYQRRGLRPGFRTARPPAPGEPSRPFLRDDPNDIRQVAAAFATAFLNREQPKPGGLANGVLNHPATNPGPSGKLVDGAITLAVLAHLIADNAQHRQLANRELAGERRRHRAGRGKVSAAGNRDRPLGCPLQPGREDRRSFGWKAHWLQIAAYERPAGV